MRPIGFTPIPDRISRLAEVAYNLWWSWHSEAQDLFKQIDAQLWEDIYHNPVLFLLEVRPSALDEAAKDPDFIEAYHKVVAAFDAYQVFDKTWYQQTYADKMDKPIAYFSAEFGLHECLPIYSGGLGILSGFLLPMALGGAVYAVSMKLLNKTRQRSRQPCGSSPSKKQAPTA